MSALNIKTGSTSHSTWELRSGQRDVKKDHTQGMTGAKGAVLV